ncbi:MAG: DHH family phosphoesterase [Bacilli bacterium]|nr:DHH family phosphoesterase [Bacilli bacterium]
MKSFFDRLLEYFQISEEEYNKWQTLNESDLPSFNVFPHIDEIVEYFKKAIKEKKKILVYGDYDCDGIMSISIIVNLFKTQNYNVGYYVPNREFDGYGLTKANIDKFKELNYDIILCVDNGITLFDEIEYANKLGIEVVVFDHHKLQEGKLPNAKYFLHPDLSEIGKYNICAGQVCFYFSWAFLGEIDKYLLTLSMLSTISDMMPLRDYNRTFVKVGLKYLNEYKYENIMNLIDKKFEIINEDNIGSEVAPKINAICRMLNDNTRFSIVKYFIRDEENQEQRLKWINATNAKRKELVQSYSTEVKVEDDKNSIVLVIDKGEGIAGLIANNLLQKYNKPVVVFSTNEHNSILKGSARSKTGFDIVESFNYCKDLLVTYGGHECAGGLSLDKSNLDEFINKFDEFAKNHPFISEKRNNFKISLGEINITNYNLLRNFAPFGEDFPKPIFLLKDLNLATCYTSLDGKHLFMDISSYAKLVYFNFDKNVVAKRSANLLGTLSRNSFRGIDQIQFVVSGEEE